MKKNDNFSRWIIANKDRILLSLSMMSLTVLYFLVGLHNLGQHLYLGETDTIPFIEYTLAIRDSGSLPGYVLSLFNGSFTMSNQHPVFPAIMSLFDPDGMVFFVNVKLLNVFIGYGFVALMFFLVYRESNTAVAFFVALLLIANDTFITQAAMVSTEPLLLIFMTLGMYFLIKGIDDNVYWIPAGFFAGLAYMTKASGMFLLFGFALFLLFDVRFRFWKLFRNKYLWLFFGLFVLVSLPLLVRNTIVYKFPFYNFNVDMLAMDQHRERINETVTFFDLFHRNALYFVKRFFAGVATEFRLVVHSLYSFSFHDVPKFSDDLTSLPAKIAGALTAVFVFVTAIYMFVRCKLGRRAKLLVVFLTIGFFLPLSWYSVTAPNRRYILPLLPFFLFFSLMWIAGMIRKRLSPGGEFPMRTLVAILLAVTCVSSAVYAVTRDIPDYRETYRFENGYHEIARFLDSNASDGSCMTRGWHHYNWIMFYPALKMKMTESLYYGNFREFEDYMAANPRIAYILMQPELYRLTRNIFGEYLDFSYTNGFTLKRAIPGWRVRMIDDASQKRYILFEREGQVLR